MQEFSIAVITLILLPVVYMQCTVMLQGVNYANYEFKIKGINKPISCFHHKETCTTWYMYM